MSTSRRNFIKNGSMVALAATVPLGLAKHALAAVKDSGSGSSSRPASTRKDTAFNRNAFAELVNTEFQVNNGMVKGALELVAVTDLARPANFKEQSGKEGFSLMLT